MVTTQLIKIAWDSAVLNFQVTLWEALNKSKSATYASIQTREEQILQQ